MKYLKWYLLSLSSFLLQSISQTQPLNITKGLINSATNNQLYDLIVNELIYKESSRRHRNRRENINKVVLYWGQGDFGEKKLSYYCDQENVSIVVLGFIVDFIGGPKKSPLLDLSDNCDDINNCFEAARDIKYCQSKGIKVLMSVGGASGPYHKQNWDPDLLAWWIWNKFLGGTDKTLPRPFGNVILDGIDYDPESVEGVGYDRHIDTLRKLFKTQYPPRDYLITSAPQCPDLDYYPKNAVYNILHPAPKYDAYPDMVFVQFYNNYCSASSHQTKKFNFNVWDKWATERTKGRTKIYLGILGKENHMDTGYVTYERLTVILDDIRRSRNFGGVMIWDAGYAYANKINYLDGVTYGEATAKYLQQLDAGLGRTINAFDTINLGFKNEKIPILIPVSNNNTDLLPLTISCDGLLFLIVKSVSGNDLAHSFGTPPDFIDEHFKTLGIDGNANINPGSHVCLSIVPESKSVIINSIYSTSTIDNNSNFLENYYK